LRIVRFEELRCRELRKQGRLNRFGTRRQIRRSRTIGPQRGGQSFEQRSGRTLEQPSDRFRIVSRKKDVQFVALMGFFANDEQDSLRRELAKYALEPSPGGCEYGTTRGGENERERRN
jgi:hypothetical protein